MKRLQFKQAVRVLGVAFALCAFVAPATAAGFAVAAQQVTAEGADIVLTLGDVRRSAVVGEDGMTYVKVALPGCGLDNVHGNPSLPLLSYTMEVPFGSAVSVLAEEAGFEDLTLDRPIYPHQPPRPKSGPRPPFRVNAAAYAGRASDAFVKARGGAPQITQFRKAGRDYVNVLLRPFAYKAAAGVLRCPGIVRVRMSFTPGAATPPRWAEAGLDRSGLILVSHDSMSTGAQALKAEKQAQGFTVYDVVVTGTQVDPGAVRDDVRAIYDAHGPGYVLILGDTRQVPTFMSGSYPSDLLYALMDPNEDWDDYLGKDMIVGRISLESNDEAANYVAKLQAFVAACDSRKHYDLTWISHGYSPSEYAIAEGTHNWVIANCVPSGYNNALFYQNIGSAGELSAHINGGTDGVIYSGHGGTYSWARYNYNQSEVAALANNLDVPIVIGHCCITATFNVDNCFAETWMESTARGIVYVGGSGSTLWGPDDVMERDEFSAMAGGSAPTIGEGIEAGLLRVHNDYPGNAQYYYTIYQIIGDPTVCLFGVPGPDYCTEQFTGGTDSFDLAMRSITFTPDGAGGYSASSTPIRRFPWKFWNGAQLSLGDNNSVQATLGGGRQVQLFGQSYGTLFLNANGNISFDSADATALETLEAHFSQPRISLFFDDLDPTGYIIFGEQLADRVVITYAKIPEAGGGAMANAQVEIFFDGVIRLSFEKSTAADGIVGLSDGNGVPADFTESNMSSY